MTVALGLMATSAKADKLTATFDWVYRDVNVQVGANQVPLPALGAAPVNVVKNGSGGTGVSVSTNGGSSWLSESSGVFLWSRSSTSDANNNWGYAPALGNVFGSFCIQLSEYISGGQTATFDVVTLDQAPVAGPAMSIAKATSIAKLWAYVTAAHGAPTGLTNVTVGTTTESGTAAFQLAIWNLVYDGDLNLSGGTFQATASNVTTVAQDMLTQSGLSTVVADMRAIAVAGIQDQVFLTDAPGPAVPLPSVASAFVGLLFAGGLGMRRLRRVIS